MRALGIMVEMSDGNTTTLLGERRHELVLGAGQHLVSVELVHVGIDLMSIVSVLCSL